MVVDSTTPATCTSAKLVSGHCNGSGHHTYTWSEGSALGHLWINKTITEPTYNETGTGRKYCSRCHTLGSTYTIPKLDCPGHEFDEGTIIKEPSYTEDGEISYICQICGYERIDTIPMNICSEHAFDDGEIIIEPTHEEEGEIKYTCTICGYTYTDVLPVLEPEIVVPEPAPIIIYDGMETISENSLRFYEDSGIRLYNIEYGVNMISSNMICLHDDIHKLRQDNKQYLQYMKSVSDNTAELVRLQTNDINNEDMLNQLSRNIEKLNTRLTELSTYLGYFFAFMIFIMIVIIFKGCWKLIDKYLLNVTLR